MYIARQLHQEFMMCDKIRSGDMTQKQCPYDDCSCIIIECEDPKLWCKDGCVKTPSISIPPPKTAYERILEKRRLNKNVVFTEEHCQDCEAPIYTDGKLFWCSENCCQNGKRREKDPGGFGFISDLIR